MEKLEVSYTVSERSLIRQTNRWWYTQPRFHRTFQLIQQNFEIKNQQQKKQGGQLLWYHGNPIFLISRNDIILSNISLKNQSRSRGPKWLICPKLGFFPRLTSSMFLMDLLVPIILPN